MRFILVLLLALVFTLASSFAFHVDMNKRNPPLDSAEHFITTRQDRGITNPKMGTWSIYRPGTCTSDSILNFCYVCSRDVNDMKVYIDCCEQQKETVVWCTEWLKGR
ncbi:unnamed protein product [Owenia fusiformis]|nr:unnamed protein product [Owenia fusiformis]